MAQIAALTAQVRENSIRFMALEYKIVTLRHENHTLQECFSTIESIPQLPHDLRFRVLVPPMQPLVTSEPGSISSQPLGHQSTGISGSTTAPLTSPLVINGYMSVPTNSTVV